MKPKEKDNMEKFIREVGEEGAPNAVASAQECTGLLASEPGSRNEYENGMDLYQTESRAGDRV